MIFLKKLLCIIIFMIAFLSACESGKSGSVEREDLFSLEIGPMEDQLALYMLAGSSGIKHIGFTMRDGLFYIADGKSGKIVRYNSYGNLLFMIYNEETNPLPVSLKTNVSEDEQTTRWAWSYPLLEPGWITVNTHKHIYVEDRLPLQSYRFDQESNSQLDGVILHFDQNGRFVDYLGREGIGGSPFPRITGLSSSVRDELAVICRISDGWNIYWYNAQGALLYLVKIASSAIPFPADWAVSFSSLDCIAAAIDARKLYLKIDYYRDTFDQSTNTRTGSEPAGSVIWTLDVENSSYSSSIEVPLYELIENGKPAKVSMFYSMLGVMRNGKALLYFPDDSGYAIIFVDTNSREQRRGHINFSNEELRFSDFYLSPDGILSALLVDDFNVKIVWWRTDKFIGEVP